MPLGLASSSVRNWSSPTMVGGAAWAGTDMVPNAIARPMINVMRRRMPNPLVAVPPQ